MRKEHLWNYGLGILAILVGASLWLVMHHQGVDNVAVDGATGLLIASGGTMIKQPSPIVKRAARAKAAAERSEAETPKPVAPPPSPGK